jgi:hypothetical protein
MRRGDNGGGQGQPFGNGSPVVAVAPQIGDHGPELGDQGVGCRIGFRRGFRLFSGYRFRAEAMTVGVEIPGELHRVYPVADARSGASNGSRTDTHHPDTAALAEAKSRAALAEQRLADLKAALDDMRGERDAWRDQAQRLAILAPVLVGMATARLAQSKPTGEPTQRSLLRPPAGLQSSVHHRRDHFVVAHRFGDFMQ